VARWRRALRFIPWSRVIPTHWLVSVVAVFFYVFLAVVATRLSMLMDLVVSPRPQDRLGALAIVIALSLLYAAAVVPQLLDRRVRESAWGEMMQRFQANRMAVVGLLLFLILLSASLLTPLLSPYDPAAQSDPAQQQYQPPSRAHLMGTDRLGRDVFSRVLYGSRVSLAVGVLAVSLASVLGLVFGAFAGYVGGWVDEAAMRVVDGLLAFPRLLLVLTLLAFLVNSFWLVVLLLAGTGWMGVSRLVRAQVLSLKERDFVQAAVAAGVGPARIVCKHLVPNTIGVVMVASTLRIGTIILFESYLSFLGLGVRPPTPSWGLMVFEGRDVLLSAWWVSAFPGIAIVLAVIACNLVGDGLRDAADVKTA